MPLPRTSADVSRSPVELLADLSPSELLDVLLSAQLTEEEAAAVTRERPWSLVARPEQRLPAGAGVDYTTIAYVQGRGTGKTFSASSNFHQHVHTLARQPRSRRGRGTGVIVHRTSADLREVCVEGEDGLLATAPRWSPVKYEPTKRLLTWDNGYKAVCLSAEKPDALRGPSFSLAWGEEFASWKGERGVDGATAYDNLKFTMRGRPSLGLQPLTMLTTTAKRTKAMKDLEARALDPSDRVRIVRGSTFDNLRNLPPSFIMELLDKFAGTTLGLQELMGLLANDVDGASFRSAWFEASRVTDADMPELSDVIVAVDPSISDGSGDECGIVVVGLSAGPLPDGKRHVYVLEDYSISGSPDRWARRVDQAATDWGTTTVVVEANQGGEMCKTVLHSVNRSLRVKTVHATTGKATRAETAAALFEQGRAHIYEEEPDLEDQATTWTPADRSSPDRMDAMVHGINYLEPKMRGSRLVATDTNKLKRRIG